MRAVLIGWYSPAMMRELGASYWKPWIFTWGPSTSFGLPLGFFVTVIR